jgi:hypothetical protein
VLRDHTGDIFDRHVPADQLKLVSKQARSVDEQDDVYEVKKIIDHRGEPGSYEYLVDWVGYDADDRTWVKDSSFLDHEVIRRYWRERNANASSSSSSSSSPPSSSSSSSSSMDVVVPRRSLRHRK